MKKTFIYTLAILFLFVGIAFAGPFGTLNVDASTYGGGIDCDSQYIPNGWAGGISGAIGGAEANACGFIINGTVSGNVTAVGGGLTNTTAKVLYNPKPEKDKSIGVGSFSENEAYTGASLDISVDPGRRGFGIAGGEISGFVAQGTLNASLVGPSPLKGWETEGFTGGIAGQGSMGGFSGGAFVMAGPDYTDRRNPIYYGGEPGGPGYYVKIYGNSQIGRAQWFSSHPDGPSEWVFLGEYREYPIVNSYANASAGAGIHMFGNSYSLSYRYMNDAGIYHTEGMGTEVLAETVITSYGYNYNWGNGLDCSHSNLDGGWRAVGGAATMTTQDAPDMGGAEASAFGLYTGSGQLGTNYNGLAEGYSGTAITTANGMNGSINSASAGMSVTSQVSSGCDPM